MLPTAKEAALLAIGLGLAGVVACTTERAEDDAHHSASRSPATEGSLATSADARAAVKAPSVVAVINASSPADDPFGGFRCAGVLVKAQAVLTATHCTAGSKVDVIVGADNLCNTAPIVGERIEVTTIERKRDDLAVLHLRMPSKTPPARLAPAAAQQPRIAVGWGLPEAARFACTRQTASLRFMGEAQCNQAKRRAAKETSIYTCALPIAGRNTCIGDSGGPVFAIGVDRSPPTLALTDLTVAGIGGCRTTDVGLYRPIRPTDLN